jgi:dienelactone hydrolase
VWRVSIDIQSGLKQNARKIFSLLTPSDFAKMFTRRKSNCRESPTVSVQMPFLQRIHAALLLRLLAISLAFCGLTASCFATEDGLPLLPKNFGEQVVRIPLLDQPSMTLEATIFKPPGTGPFPLLVFNHGKDSEPDAHKQERSRPWVIIREFVTRGYVVVAPNRQGFSRSDGKYALRDCNVTADGLRQIEDVRATVSYMFTQPYVDASRILISGASQGGLISIAYGTRPDSGVRALINFNGGSRQVGCQGWERNIVNAYSSYGRSSRLPSIWVYGKNDQFWSPELVQQMVNAFRSAGGKAEFVDIGVFKNDAHRIVGDADGTSIWWPSVETFLSRLGLPTKVLYRSPEAILPASHFASVDQVDVIPYLDAKGKDGYREFLKHGNPRIFTLSDQGKWSYAISGEDPLGRALSGCQKQSPHPCKPYVIDDDVVWTGGSAASVPTKTTQAFVPQDFAPIPKSSGYASINDVTAVPYINDHGRDAYRQFLAHSGPRAIVIVKTGSFTISYGGNSPMESAMRSCQSHYQNACEPYAVNDTVVWVRNSSPSL